MAQIKTLKTNFIGGELSPEMFGRLDNDLYAQGLGLCRNFIVKPQGAVENRAGFEFVRSVKYPERTTRLIPFFFDVTQTLILEFGDRYVRFHTFGATVLDSASDAYEVATPYSAADVFDIHYVQSADVLTLVHPRYAPRELRRYGATDWRLVRINFSPTINPPSNVQVSATLKDGEKAETYKYKVTAVAQEDYAESLASAVVVAENQLLNTGAKNTITWGAVPNAAHYHVYRSFGGTFCFLGLADTTEFVDDNITPDASKTVPIYDKSFASGGISSVEVIDGGSGYGGVGDGVIVGAGKVYNSDISAVGRFHSRISTEVGRPFRESNSAPFSGVYIPRGEFKFDFEPKGDGSGAMVRVLVDKNHVLKVQVTKKGSGYPNNTKIKLFKKVVTNGVGKWVQASTNFYATLGVSGAAEVHIQDATGYGAVLQAVIANGSIARIDVLHAGQNYSNPKITISGAGTGATVGTVRLEGAEFPGTVSYFQQRRVFAGSFTKPQTVWLTRSGTESNLSYSIPARDDDRVNITVAAREASRILHIVPTTSLLLLTGSAEWRMTGTTGDIITPSGVQVSPQSFVGANNVQPLMVNSNTIYAASRGGHMRELGYKQQAGGFVTGDISLRAAHLFDDMSVVDITQTKAPIPIIWAVSSGGALLGCTYIPEQNIGAWHKHDTYKGRFLSCAAVSEGETDALYVVVDRTINGNHVRNIERMRKRSFVEAQDAFFVDSGLTYEGAPTKSISGLFHLEGETVHILADGAVIEPQKVLLGKIKLPEEASVVHIGLPIFADLKTLPMAAQIDHALGQGRQKNINKVWLRVQQSGGIFIGQDENNLTEVKQRTIEPMGSPPDLKTGEIRLNITPKWAESGTVFVRQHDPLPLTVVSMTAEVSVGG